MRCLKSPLRLLQNRPAAKSVALFACYFLLIALALRRFLYYGFTGDESGYVAMNTEEFAGHLWLPYIFVPGLDTGHPMLYTYPVAVLWRLFGQSNATANLMMWICAALSMVAVHRLAEHVLRPRMGEQTPKWAGPAAAAALFSTPLFISHAMQYIDSMPYAALVLWMLVSWIEGRRRTLALLGGMLALTRITACLSVLGLGLYDLAYSWIVLRRRSWRGMIGALAPYLGSGGMFLTYWFIKLVVLRRPFVTFRTNKPGFANWETIQSNAQATLKGIFSVPPYSFSLLLGVAAAGLLAAWGRGWLRRAGGTEEAADPGSGPLRPASAGIYGAALASMIFPTIFLSCYPYWPQPRWFLSYHAFFVVMGVHGLIALFGRRLWLVAPILGLWCGAQMVRWHSHWVERYCGARFPNAPGRLSVVPPFTLDVVYRKRLNHQAADWIADHTRRPIVVCAYPTSALFSTASSGYGMPPCNPVGVWWLKEQLRKKPAGNDALGKDKPVYLVLASWDMEYDLKTVNELKREGVFREVYKKQSKSREWIKIYRVQRPAAGAGAIAGTAGATEGAKNKKS